MVTLNEGDGHRTKNIYSVLYRPLVRLSPQQTWWALPENMHHARTNDRLSMLHTGKTIIRHIVNNSSIIKRIHLLHLVQTWVLIWYDTYMETFRTICWTLLAVVGYSLFSSSRNLCRRGWLVGLRIVFYVIIILCVCGTTTWSVQLFICCRHRIVFYVMCVRGTKDLIYIRSYLVWDCMG